MTLKNTQLKKIFIFADKKNNLYSTNFTNYKNLTTNNVTHKLGSQRNSPQIKHRPQDKLYSQTASLYNNQRGVRGVTVIVVGNEHGDTSSNPGRD